MGFLDNLKYLNPFSKVFKDNIENEIAIERELESNSVSVGEVEQSLSQEFNYDNQLNGFVSLNTISFNDTFEGKAQRISKYREMSYYPEIGEALDIICDESILQDSEGKILKLKLKHGMSDNIYKLFHEEFNYIIDDVLKIKDNLYDIFSKWLIEGELYVELILNNEKNKVIGYKILPSYTVSPVYSRTGNIVKFMQYAVNTRGQSMEPIYIERNQLAYINWGKYGKDKLDPRGYLEGSIKTYNQLKNLEDSIIVYRLVRAPERRVWNIEVGRLPTQKAEQYIRKIIHKYKRQTSYNPTTGNIDASKNIQSLSEDFWFAKRDGQGTNIETIGGGQQLGELDDVKYFLSKMYKTLKLPRTRWDSQTGSNTYQSGKEMDREELKFSLFINRIQSKFKKLIIDIYFEHLKFKYSDTPNVNKYLNRGNFDVLFTPSNFFKEEKDLELVEKRLGILATAMQYTTSPSDSNQPLSKEYVMKKYFQMSDEEYRLNSELAEKERKENEKKSLEDAERQGEINTLATPEILEEPPIEPENIMSQTENFSNKIEKIKKYLIESQKGK
jgi:hypothetical protein